METLGGRLGIFVVLREGPQHQICYLGSGKPKIILLVLEDQYGRPNMWMIGATAYNIPLQGGPSVPSIFDAAVVRPSQDSDTHAWLEHCEGQTWILTPMYTCKQAGCLACFLPQMRELEYCPLHSAHELHPTHLAHIVCVQGIADTKLSVLGWIASISDHAKFWVFHVVKRNEAAQVTEHADFTALPTETPILCPRSDSSLPTYQNFDNSQFNRVHEGWPFQDYQHFLIRTGGDQKCFESWLLARSQFFA